MLSRSFQEREHACANIVATEAKLFSCFTSWANFMNDENTNVFLFACEMAGGVWLGARGEPSHRLPQGRSKVGAVNTAVAVCDSNAVHLELNETQCSRVSREKFLPETLFAPLFINFALLTKGLVSCFQIPGALFPSFMEFQLDSAEYCQAQHK